GSIVVAAQDPTSAAREIDRVGQHPGMVQVAMAVHAPYRGYGEKFYDPIWEAAVRNNLVVCFHVSLPIGLFQANATGAAKHFIELQTTNSLPYQAQLVNMVFGGVFEKFPELKVVFVEGGFTWVPHVLYAM